MRRSTIIIACCVFAGCWIFLAMLEMIGEGKEWAICLEIASLWVATALIISQMESNGTD